MAGWFLWGKHVGGWNRVYNLIPGDGLRSRRFRDLGGVFRMDFSFLAEGLNGSCHLSERCAQGGLAGKAESAGLGRTG